MNSAWQQWLQSAGAKIEDGRVGSFGDAKAELEAAGAGDVLADLSHLGALEFTGDDSEAFLQAQLTCDVHAIEPNSSSLGSYCTPKGRMLASFLLWRIEGGFRMALSRGIVPAVHKRLKMYVLRSKVQIAEVSDRVVLLGVSGAGAARALAPVSAGLPQRTREVASLAGGGSLIAVPEARFVLSIPVEAAAGIWTALASMLRPVGTPCWEWLDIRAGVPLITEKTQEQFLPQMANLELIGGVSFKKGCFPGQEVVARTQHLGRVKRRMFLARLDDAGEVVPAPGDDIFSDDIPGQASGMVVNAQPAPEGGYELLAVLQLSSRDGSAVHVGSAGGPVLRFLDLPYPVS